MTQGKLKVWCLKLNAKKTEFWLFRNRSGAERYATRVLIPSLLRVDLTPDVLTNKEWLRKAAIQEGDKEKFVGFLHEMVKAVGKSQFGRAVELFSEFNKEVNSPITITIKQENVL